MRLLFQDKWTTAGLRKIERGNQRVVAGADDDRVVHRAYVTSARV